MTNTIQDTNTVLFMDLSTGVYLTALSDNYDDGADYLIRQGRHYIWTGSYVAVDGIRCYARVLEENSRNFRLVKLDQVCSMRPVLEVDSLDMKCANGFERMLIGCLVQDELSNKMVQDRYDAMQSEINGLREDFVTFNEFMNSHADSQGWCSEYESIQARVNPMLKHFQLEGRAREYVVSYQITATYGGQVRITATSEEAAREALSENYDESDLLSTATDQDSYPSTDVNYDDMSVERN